jgi:Tol biopolymer transport system component
MDIEYLFRIRVSGWVSVCGLFANCLLGCFTSVLAQDEFATLQAMPTSDPRNIDGTPAWSPDGKSIVFGSGRSGSNDIWIIGIDGSGLKNLTPENPTDDYKPQWSRDGHYIAFISDREDKYDLWRMDADGTNVIRLKTPVEMIGFDYSWSPDSQYIAFIGVQNARQNVWIINADGTGVSNLTEDTTYDYLQLSWSPDSKNVVATSALYSSFQFGLTLIAIDGKHQTDLITPSTERVILYTAYSPTEDQIAFSQNATSATFSDVWTVHADGSDLRNITNTETEFENGAWWSPDGHYLLFTCITPNSNEICRVDTDGSNRLQLTNDGTVGVRANRAPSWSPDSRRIAYVKTQNSGSSIWLMDADGSNQINLTGQQ